MPTPETNWTAFSYIGLSSSFIEEEILYTGEDIFGRKKKMWFGPDVLTALIAALYLLVVKREKTGKPSSVSSGFIWKRLEFFFLSVLLGENQMIKQIYLPWNLPLKKLCIIADWQHHPFQLAFNADIDLCGLADSSRYQWLQGLWTEQYFLKVEHP